MPPRQTMIPSPLTTWGGFNGRRRGSDSPYIESIWEGTAARSGTHMTAADGTIDLTFQKRQGVTRLLLSGPTSRARHTTYRAGDEALTVRLRTGVHLVHLHGPALADAEMFLPNAGSRHIWLDSHAIALPSFDNIELLAEHLAKARILRRDIVVEDALADKLMRTDIRTMQRHFKATTGMTMNYVRQIRRAEKARDMLSGDSTLTAIAYDAGYSNPGHMTNALKHFFGYTPTALRSLMTSR